MSPERRAKWIDKLRPVVLRWWCPYCRAPEGRPCRDMRVNAYGRYLPDAHADRYLLARQSLR